MDRTERAKKAAEERWNPTVPRASHSGILIIGGKEIECDVLEDGRRILRQKALLTSIGKSDLGGSNRKRAKELNLPVFLTANNLIPYLRSDFIQRAQTVTYRGINGQKLKGYDATLLPETCKVYVQAEEDGVLQSGQLKICKICKVMLYGLATVGIISLVDDATGYVEHRSRTELEKILEKYISEELRQWTKKFPNEFFKQIYRLYGWTYPKVKKNHPQYVGKIINKYIYDDLPPGVLEELKLKNPVNEHGKRSHKHHQFLTEDIGDSNLKAQITKIVTLMKHAENIEDFKRLVSRQF